MEPGETRRGIYDVGRGENVGLADDTLAIAITTTMTVVFTGRHVVGLLPRLRRGIDLWVVCETEDRSEVGWID